MAAPVPAPRCMFKYVFKHFINSFRPRQIRGDLIGSDDFGTKYYEIPANPKIGKRRANRWFEPVTKNNFEQELPAEWESWLRGRRKTPPLLEEISKNAAIAQMKRDKAAAIDKKYGNYYKKDDAPPETDVYPKYKEYEVSPGVPPR